MLTESTPYLIVMYENIDKLLLIFVRVISFIYLLPVFAGTNVPTTVKIMFSFIISVLLFSTGVANDAVIGTTAIGYGLSVAKEIATGLLLGFVVYLVFTIVYLGGQMMDYAIGFSMVSVMDPVSQIQVPITGNLIYYIMTMLFVVSGGLNSVLYVFFDSFRQIPIGTANFMIDQGLVQYMVDLTATYFVLGLRIAAPILGTILVVDIALGILVKASPQMNVFVVGMPIKLLVGLILLVIISPYLFDVFSEIYDLAFRSLTDVIGGISNQ